MPQIGIPRALLYYQYYPMWRAFFEQLGAQVILSPPTNKDTLRLGASRVVAETCLPVKIFVGHAISLIDKCDYMFVPAIRTMEPKVHNCSKFLGLPDMTRAVVPEAPPILDVDIDVDKGKRELSQAIYKLGRHFTWNPLKIKRATEAARAAHLDFQNRMWTQRRTPIQVLKEIFPELESDEELIEEGDKTIALIGHPYLLYDKFVNYRLIHHLQRLGSKVVTPEMVERQEIDAAIIKLGGEAYWTYEGEVVGAGGYYLDAEVDGVIALIAFGCGPDSLMISLVQRYAKHVGKPFMTLTLDEHTSEIGLLTRLEAFLDMIQRKRRVGFPV